MSAAGSGFDGRHMAEVHDILIVTGAHLHAEVADRPMAYALRSRVMETLARLRDVPTPDDRVIVCSDVWYLNTESLRACPVISIGGPGVNALTAYLGDKIPSAVAIEGEFVVQYDVATHEPIAACWGASARGTRAAVDAFAARFLEPFLRAATAGE